MRVKIDSDDCHMTFRLPTTLVLSRLTVTILEKVFKERINLLPENNEAFFRQLRVCRKYCRGITIVDIESSNGDKVKISM